MSNKRHPPSPRRSRRDNSPFAIHHDIDQTVNEACLKADELFEDVLPRRDAMVNALSPTKPNAARHELPPSLCSQQEPQGPQTPRHRDAPSKRNPATPRHRVRVGGPPLTPRTPRTPQHSTCSAVDLRSVYHDAKRCLFDSEDNAGNAGQLVGRTSERAELQAFLSARIATTSGGALYVSGPPGTGKSAMISQVTRDMSLPSTLRHCHLNCMSVKSAADVYNTLLSELGVSDNMFDACAKDTLAGAVLDSQSHDQYLVVLDEIDALLDMDVEVLYNMFEWSLRANSRLILVGIANALDLTDRFLPNLRARGHKPQLLPFLPYTATDISSILTFKLRSLLPTDGTMPDSFTPVLMPPAIQLISKKVAAQTGDLRKAFDISQKVIALIEAETKAHMAQQQQDMSPSKAPLGENANLSSPRSTPSTPTKQPKLANASMSSLTATTAPRAAISHVVRVTSASFSNGTKERLLGLNLQQKAVLTSLAALEQHDQRNGPDSDVHDVLSQSRTGLLPSPSATPSKKRARMTARTPTKHDSRSAPKLRIVFGAYSTLCTRENSLSALSYGEFRDVVCNLETMGLVTAADGKEGSFVQPSTPKRRGRSTGGITATKMDEKRVHGTAGVDELKASLESAGAVKAMLMRMLEGRDL